MPNPFALKEISNMMSKSKVNVQFVEKYKKVYRDYVLILIILYVTTKESNCNISVNLNLFFYEQRHYNTL